MRSLYRPSGFLTSPAFFMCLPFYEERYVERNKGKVSSLHNSFKGEVRFFFLPQQKINIFPPRGTWAGAPVPPESMDQILGAPPTFTAFLMGPTAGCRQAQQEIRPRSGIDQPRHQQGQGRFEQKNKKTKTEVQLWVSSFLRLKLGEKVTTEAVARK